MLKAGTILEKYEIIEPIAAGGMGVVYRAKHTTIGREVAVKLLLDNYALSEKVRRRFEQEAYVQAQLDHVNIVRVHDLIREPETLAIVMDYISGVSLAECLNDEKTEAWSVKDTIDVMDPIVQAIVYAHERGVVHRDIKPGNILLDRRSGNAGLGTPKVTDFGLAKILTDTEQHTKTGSKMGTLPYMAPEQFQGLKSIGPQADLYALAMMAWRLLAGKLPIAMDDMIAACNLYTGQSAMPALSPLNPEVTPLLEEALAAGLLIDQAERSQSVQSWWNNLKRASQSDATYNLTTASNDADTHTKQIIVATDSDISVEEAATDQASEGQLRSWGDSPRGPAPRQELNKTTILTNLWPIVTVLALIGITAGVEECGKIAEEDTVIRQEVDDLVEGCNQDQPTECRELADRYNEGLGVEKNSFMARSLYTRACELKDAMSCFKMGQHHEKLAHSRGVSLGKRHPDYYQEHNRSYRFYKRACVLGSSDGCQGRRRMK